MMFLPSQSSRRDGKMAIPQSDKPHKARKSRKVVVPAPWATLPNVVRTKRQKRKWGSEHARWASARVFEVAREHIVVRDDSTGKHHRLSVAEVNNRLMRA